MNGTKKTPAEIAASLGKTARALIASPDVRVFPHNQRERSAVRALTQLGLLDDNSIKTLLGRHVRAAIRGGYSQEDRVAFRRADV